MRVNIIEEEEEEKRGAVIHFNFKKTREKSKEGRIGKEGGTDVVDVEGSRRDLAVDGVDQIAVVGVGDGGSLLGGAGDGEPELGAEERGNALSDELLEGDGVADGVGEGGEVVEPAVLLLLLVMVAMVEEVPVGAPAGLHRPPNPSLAAHPLPDVVEDVEVVHIPFHREAVEVLEFEHKARPPRVVVYLPRRLLRPIPLLVRRRRQRRRFRVVVEHDDRIGILLCGDNNIYRQGEVGDDSI